MYYAIHKQTKHHRIVDHDTLVSDIEDIVLADADGWIEFNQDECPLPGKAECEAKSSNGHVVHFRQAKSCMNWHAVRFYRPILPTPEPKPEWRGPQDGLPPVGTVCEFQAGYSERPFKYSQCRIIAHFMGESGKMLAAFTYEAAHDGVIQVSRGAPELFRPIRTPEEIAEERAVEALADSFGGTDVSLSGIHQECLAKAAYLDIRDGRIPGVACKPEPFRGVLDVAQDYFHLQDDGDIYPRRNTNSGKGYEHVSTGRVFLTRRDALLFAAFESED